MKLNKKVYVEYSYNYVHRFLIDVTQLIEET